MNLKNKVVARLKKVEIPYILSCSIIGSFIFKKEFDNVEDVDIYLILDKMDIETYRKLAYEFDKICKNLSTKNTKFVMELRAGAFKPKPRKGKKIIQLHVLINTPEMVSNKSPMVALDWRLSNMHIRGRRVSYFLKTKKFSKNDLLNGRDGLRYLLSLLESDKKAYMEWTVKNSAIERVKKEVRLDEDDLFDLIQFVVIQGFTNFIRLDKPKFLKLESKIIEKAKKLHNNHYALVKDVFVIKNKLKNNEKVKLNIKDLKDKAFSFIEYLIKELEK